MAPDILLLSIIVIAIIIIVTNKLVNVGKINKERLISIRIIEINNKI